MAAWSLMAWHYLRAAVLHRWRLPVLGDVPVNLAALGVFGVMGFDNPVFWAAGGGFEALWLVLTAGRTGYRRNVDAARRRLAWREAEERRLTLYSRLTPEARARHHTLRTACLELARVSGGEGSGGGGSGAAAELFIQLHLRLLLAREALAAGRGTDPADDDDLHRLHALAVLDVADPAASRLAEQALALLESRRRSGEDAGRRLALTDQQIAWIEAETATARRTAGADRLPHDFRHSLQLARDRLREDQGTPGGAPPPAAETD